MQSQAAQLSLSPSLRAALLAHPEAAAAGRRAAAGRVAALDGFRGVAILFVVLSHTGCVLPGGFIGVDLFFVLSGFLITRLLLGEMDRSGGIHLGRFYLGRLVRLGPGLWVTVLGAI